MLESDPASWQDELLGDKLMEFFQKMLKKLEKKDFPNYFLRKQNFVHELSGHKLAQAQERTFRIIENIVPIHVVVSNGVIISWSEGGICYHKFTSTPRPS